MLFDSHFLSSHSSTESPSKDTRIFTWSSWQGLENHRPDIQPWLFNTFWPYLSFFLFLMSFFLLVILSPFFSAYSIISHTSGPAKVQAFQELLKVSLHFFLFHMNTSCLGPYMYPFLLLLPNSTSWTVSKFSKGYFLNSPLNCEKSTMFTWLLSSLFFLTPACSSVLWLQKITNVYW